MLSLQETVRLYANLIQELTDDEYKDAASRLCKIDLFFLLTQVLGRRDLINQWYYDRCREFEAAPDGYLDLWSRGSGKSSIITFGATIQEILKNPEITIGIFSITRSIATKFVEQLKLEMEGNKFLVELYPDIFEDNANMYKRWSSEKGLLIKRQSNPKEATVEACGLIEGMPTGRHYQLLIYDDCATERSVSTADMNQKTLSQWELSLNLCDPHNHRFRYIGTRYAKGDLYEEIMDRGAAIPRIRVAVNPDGSSILWDEAYIKQRRAEMGSRTWASQILQDPSGEGNADFSTDWIRYYTKSSGWGRMNRYILVDPASTKSKRADYTCMIVFGVGADDNYYIIDIIRDKLNLTERAKTLFDLVYKYKPIRVGYEKYGMNTDIDHIKYMMTQEQFHFPIVPLGGTVLNKEDRIRRLIPLFEQGRIYIPMRGEIKHTNYNQQVYDPLISFLEEYESFPFSAHDDVMDALSRMVDKDMNVRRPSDNVNNRVKKYGDYKVLGR